MSRNSDPIPFARPSIGREEEEAVLSVLRSGWLTTAEHARSFEEEFSRYTGSRYALAVNSATAGLHLSLEALGIGPGDTVITTPYTFTASAEVVHYLGARIEFADIDKTTLTISPEEIERILAKSGGVKAIIPVHLGGHPCDMERLLEISRHYRVPIVEDAAHAFPVVYGDEAEGKRAPQSAPLNGRYLGTFGATGVFSFYATKTITTGEGGMVTTDDEKTAERIRHMRLHGIDREIWNRYREKKASWRYDVIGAGYKYNLPDIAAALGRIQLSKAESFKQRRAEIAETYLSSFSDCDFLTLPSAARGVSSSGGDHAWHLFILQIVPHKLDIDRDSYIEYLQEEGIGVSVHYIPLHIMSYYKSVYGFREDDFPASVEVYRNAFSLPIYPALSDNEVERIIHAVKKTGKAHYRATQHESTKRRGGFNGS